MFWSPFKVDCFHITLAIYVLCSENTQFSLFAFLLRTRNELELSLIYLFNQFYWWVLLFSLWVVFLLGWKWPFLTITLTANPLCSFTPLWVWYLLSSQSASPHLSPILLGYQLPLPTAKSIQMSMLCLVNHDPTCSPFSVTFDSLIALAFHCFCLPNSQ